MTPGEDKSGKPMSLRAYARRRGASVQSVSQAVKKQRLKLSVVYVGSVPKIGNPELADREWEANTDLSRAPGYVKERAAGQARAKRGPAISPLTQASADEKAWRAKLAELDYLRKSGELVNAAEVERRLVDVFTRCRTKLLALPSKTKAALPHLTHADVVTIDRLLREALEDLAQPEPFRTTVASGTAA